MASITAQLRMVDRFSNVLNQAVQQIEALDDTAERALQPIVMDIDTARIMAAQANLSAINTEIQAISERSALLDHRNDLLASSYVGISNNVDALKTKLDQLAKQPESASNRKAIEQTRLEYNKQLQSMQAVEAEASKLSLAMAHLEGTQAKLSTKAVKAAADLNKMQKSEQAAGNDALKLVTAQDSAASAIEGSGSSARKAASGQEAFNQSMQNGIRSANSLKSSLNGLLTKYLGFQALKGAARGVKNFISSALGFSSEQEQQMISLSGTLGENVGRAYANHLKETAGSYDYATLLGNTRMFSSYTKNVRMLEKFNKQAKKLTILDPTQGLEGAGFAIKEMLGGDFTSLKGRFGMSSADIQSIKKGAKTFEDLSNNFEKWLNKRGATDQTLGKMEKSFDSVSNTIKSKFESRMAQVGTAVQERLLPAMERLNAWFDTPQADRFFATLTSMIATLVEGFIWLGEKASQAIVWIGENIDWLVPMIGSIIAGLLVYKAVSAASAMSSAVMGGAAGGAGLKFMFLAMAIAAAIFGLVMLMRKSETAREVAATVAAGIATAFQVAAGLVVTAFDTMYNIVISILNAIIGAVNGVTGGINSAMSGIGGAFGIDMPQIPKIPLFEKRNVGVGMLGEAIGGIGEKKDRYKSFLDENIGEGGAGGLNALLNKFDSMKGRSDSVEQGIFDNTEEIGDWATGSGGNGGGGGGSGAPVTVTNDVDAELVKLLREKDEGIILRQHYTEDRSVSVSGNSFTAQTNGASMDDVFDSLVDHINKGRVSSPSKAYGGNAL